MQELGSCPKSGKVKAAFFLLNQFMNLFIFQKVIGERC